MSIYKEMSGRLGNQFFQFATLMAFKEKYNLKDKIILDFSNLKKQGSEEDGFRNALNDFKISDYNEGKIHINIFQRIIYILNL